MESQLGYVLMYFSIDNEYYIMYTVYILHSSLCIASKLYFFLPPASGVGKNWVPSVEGPNPLCTGLCPLKSHPLQNVQKFSTWTWHYRLTEPLHTFKLEAQTVQAWAFDWNTFLWLKYFYSFYDSWIMTFPCNAMEMYSSSHPLKLH